MMWSCEFAWNDDICMCFGVAEDLLVLFVVYFAITQHKSNTRNETLQLAIVIYIGHAY